VWRQSGIDVLNEGSNKFLVQASAWKPVWLDHTEEDSPEVPAVAGFQRRHSEPASADPFLVLMNLSHYLNAGQREAVRAAMSAPPTSTLVVNLPTGSGKSLCAHLPALWRSQPFGITIVIVPTTALAIDQERALKNFLAHDTAYYGDSSVEGKA